MTRTKSAATVQTPGASAKSDETPAKAKKPTSNVAAQAKSKAVKGHPDPTTLKQPVFSEAAGGWVCPAKPDQITVIDEVEADDEESDEADED
jgi:hypothetical protein